MNSIVETADATAIQRAASLLEAGSLVVMPTDTVYGIAAHPDVPGSIDRLCQAKGRDRGKPIPVLVTGLAAAEARGAVTNDMCRRLAKRFWPGPLTIVMAAGNGLCGFRVPDHPVAIALLEGTGGALLVTSANRSGQPPATTARDAANELRDSVSLVLDAGPSPVGRASTVVRADGDTIVVLRHGAISTDEVVLCANGQ